MVSWKSKKQQTISKSLAKAECHSMANATYKIVWLLALFKDLQVHHPKPTLLFGNNKATLHIATNPIFHERTKHFEIDCHLVRKKVQNGVIKILHISSQHQLSEKLTKPLFLTQFDFLLSKMRVNNIYCPSLEQVLRIIMVLSISVVVFI